MLSEVTVMKYELNFFFEWGADCASIWCKNQKAFDKFGNFFDKHIRPEEFP